MRHLLFLTILSITFCHSLSAQTDEKAGVELGGLILDAESLKPIAGAVIMDEKKNEVTLIRSLNH